MNTADDDDDFLVPGDEISFSTRWFIDYPHGFYNPFNIKLGPLPKQGPAPGTRRTGIVSRVATDKAVLVKITSEAPVRTQGVGATDAHHRQDGSARCRAQHRCARMG